MYYRQPRYFTDFHCIGGDCPNDCCHGWTIDWSEEEVEKLRSAPNISRELRELADKMFIPNGKIAGENIIKFDENNNCPFLTEDKLCKIQKELGAEYLSTTCMVYPRHYILANDIMYRYCNMSCPEIMRKLLNDEKSLDFVNVPFEKHRVTISHVTQNSPKL